MGDSPARSFLRRGLEAHLNQLGYSGVRKKRLAAPAAEIVRISPVRGRIAYGETVLHEDLRSRRCHERLLFFSQRRTRHRSSILFFIGVAEPDRADLEALLAQLGIRNSVRGGHVQIVSIPVPDARRPARGRRSRVADEDQRQLR